MFDFSSLDLDALSEGGAWMDVVDPRTGAKTGARFLVVGPDSAVSRKRSFDIAGTSRLSTPAAVDDRMAKWACDVVTAWEGVEWQGALLEYSPENAEILFSKSRFAREQVVNFHGERSNFLGK